MTRAELWDGMVRLAPWVPVIAAVIFVENRWNRRRDAQRAARRVVREAKRREEAARAPGLFERWVRKLFDGKRFEQNAAALARAVEGRILAYWNSFVFRKELRGWPTVRHDAPGHWRLIAWHTGPRRVQNRGGFKPPLITGLVIGCGLFVLHGSNEPIMIPVAALLFGCLSIPFWKLAQKTRLVMRFDDAVISWTGPDKEKQRVEPDGHDLGLQVIVPHRWAKEEEFKHGGFMRRNQQGETPKPLFQTASELVIHTGPDGSHWRTVAEFCNDLSGEEAARLQAAFRFVVEKIKEEQRDRAKAAVMSGSL